MSPSSEDCIHHGQGQLSPNLRGSPGSLEQSPQNTKRALCGQQKHLERVAGPAAKALALLPRAAAEIQGPHKCPCDQLPWRPQSMAARGIVPIHLLLCRGKVRRGETTCCMPAVPTALSLTCFCSARLCCSWIPCILSISSWCLSCIAFIFLRASCSLSSILRQEKSYSHLPLCFQCLHHSLPPLS